MLAIFLVNAEWISSEEGSLLACVKDFSQLKEGEAIKFSANEVNKSSNISFNSLE